MKAARDEIAKALKINPDAHFGREKYQLRALEWVVDPPQWEGWQGLPNLLGWSVDDIYGEQTSPEEAHDAVRGLSGLVVLGNAWESVDVFHALNVALQRDSVGYQRGRDGGRNTLAYFAWLRCGELIDAGKGSLLPDAPKGETLKSTLRRPDFVKADVLLDPAFRDLRGEADAWQAARTAFMVRRLKEGRHPDTDQSFWEGYKERPAPGLPGRSVPDAYHAWEASRRRLALAVVLGVPMLLAVSVAILVAIRSARVRRKREPRKNPLEDFYDGIVVSKEVRPTTFE